VKSGNDFLIDSKRNASGSCRYLGISRARVAPISESFRVADFRQPKSDQVPADEPALVDHQSARPRTRANIFTSLCGINFVIQSDAPAKPNRWFAQQTIVGERHSKKRQWLHRGNAATLRRAQKNRMPFRVELRRGRGITFVGSKAARHCHDNLVGKLGATAMPLRH